MSVNLPVYANTHFSIEEGIKSTWQKIKDTFAEDFKEDLEDRHFYISYIISHTYLETVTMSSASRIELTNFNAYYYH